MKFHSIMNVFSIIKKQEIIKKSVMIWRISIFDLVSNCLIIKTKK